MVNQNAIGVYDKGGGQFLSQVEAAAEKLSQPVTVYKKYKPKEAVDALAQHPIAIAHIFNEDWPKLCDRSQPGQIRVRVSNGNFSEPPKEENGVYILHIVRPVSKLTVEDWQAILSGIVDRDTVRALVRGENPNGLRPFFGQTIPEIVSALALLCQAYLAVFSECENPEDLTLPAERSIRENLPQKQQLVCQTKWWLEPFHLWDDRLNRVDGDRWFQWQQALQQEWRSSDSLPEELLQTLREKPSIDSPDLVRRAYSAIADRLSQV